MTVQDDYPAITILADACAGQAEDGVPEAVRAWREVARLRQWKAEADEVLAAWEGVWMIAGQPWRRGETQAQAVAREVQRLRSEVDAWMNGVADVVEPLGYDRHAACGPADLLPGLETLVQEWSEGKRHARHLLRGVQTAAAPDGNDRRPCTCGQPQTEGVIHRPDGPCFHVSEVAATPSDQVTP